MCVRIWGLVIFRSRVEWGQGQQREGLPAFPEVRDVVWVEGCTEHAAESRTSTRNTSSVTGGSQPQLDAQGVGSRHTTVLLDYVSGGRQGGHRTLLPCIR